MKYFVIALALVTTNAFAFCAWDDHECNAREAEQERQIEEVRSQQEQMRQDMYRMEREAEYQRNIEWKQEQDRQYMESREARPGIACALYGKDCG